MVELPYDIKEEQQKNYIVILNHLRAQRMLLWLQTVMTQIEMHLSI